jgi:protein-S-isoprenylcysteine O-methyltransferase Ste14
MKPINIIPPVYLFMSIVIMVLLHFLIPGIKILALPWNVLGVIPLALGIGLNLVADGSFKKNETTVKPLEESTALISTGAFRVSRHPMYLGFVLVLFGIAVLMGSLTPYAVVFIFTIFMDVVFIRFEEKELERTFGEAWFEYRSKVRRWI